MDPDPEDDDPFSLVRIDCTMDPWEWPRMLRCSVKEFVGGMIVYERVWRVDGKAVKRTENPVDGKRMEWQLPGLEAIPIVPSNIAHNVTYIMRGTGGDIETSKTFRLDTMRLWAFYGILAISIAFVYAYRKGKRTPYPEPEVSPPRAPS